MDQEWMRLKALDQTELTCTWPEFSPRLPLTSSPIFPSDSATVPTRGNLFRQLCPTKRLLPEVPVRNPISGMPNRLEGEPDRLNFHGRNPYKYRQSILNLSPVH
jgi:hypothetical protein